MATAHYQVGTTVKKGGKESAYGVGAAGFVVFLLTALRSKGWLPWGPDLDLAAGTLLTGILIGPIKSFRNFAKEHGFDCLFGPTKI